MSAVKNVVRGVGAALGIGGGNTPKFNPNQFKYNAREEAFGPTNRDIEQGLRTLSERNREAIEGIDQREGRARQTSLAEALAAQTRGEGPSLAAGELRRATDRNLAQQVALAASSRGANPTATAREVLRNQAAANQDAASTAAQMRLQEQLLAQEQLANLASNMRAQDMAAQQNALSTEANFLQDIAAIRDANRAAQMNLESMRVNQALGIGNQAVQDTMNRRDNRYGVVNTLIGGAARGLSAALGAASGGIVNGVAPEPGDSKKNDIVPAMLSPGEVILPRSVVQSRNPSQKAKEFVEALMEKYPDKIGKSKPSAKRPVGFGDILTLKAKMKRGSKNAG